MWYIKHDLKLHGIEKSIDTSWRHSVWVNPKDAIKTFKTQIGKMTIWYNFNKKKPHTNGFKKEF